MIDKINNNPIQQFVKNEQPETHNKIKDGVTNDSVKTSVSYETLLASAQQLDTEDNQAVENARNLLLSGQLDTLENIKKAAENILKFGI
ncbi:MAG: hypothetical protein WC765_11010 [Phycisphaerae bacterium]|jgi:hypothetical protein